MTCTWLDFFAFFGGVRRGGLLRSRFVFFAFAMASAFLPAALWCGLPVFLLASALRCLPFKR
ncbi:hypothetical protein, partial [Paraburkholderia hospita]